jgi:hypothetical protein
VPAAARERLQAKSRDRTSTRPNPVRTRCQC